MKYERMTVEELKDVYEAEHGKPASDGLISIFDIVVTVSRDAYLRGWAHGINCRRLKK